MQVVGHDDFTTILVLLHMCPHTTTYVSPYYYVCVLILLHVSSYYYICVLILLYICPHTRRVRGASRLCKLQVRPVQDVRKKPVLVVSK